MDIFFPSINSMDIKTQYHQLQLCRNSLSQDRLLDLPGGHIQVCGIASKNTSVDERRDTHSDVLEVSVVAREHPKWGERPMAFVILHLERAKHWVGKHIELALELKARTRERLPVPECLSEWVAVVEELPD